MSHRHPLVGELSGISVAPSQVESAPPNVFFMLHNHQSSSRKLRDTTSLLLFYLSKQHLIGTGRSLTDLASAQFIRIQVDFGDQPAKGAGEGICFSNRRRATPAAALEEPGPARHPAGVVFLMWI
jgi:hypothetical protein